VTRDMIELLLNGDSLSTVFQPIFDISGGGFELWGVEALTRGPAGTHFANASVLFDYIRLKQEEVVADRHCIAAAFASRARMLPASLPRFSVNIHAGTLERDRTFASHIETLARTYDIDTSSVIIEIVEQSTYFDSRRVIAAIEDLRSLGVRIAIDDLGLGHGNYRLILDAAPDYLKLDRYFVHGCAQDRHRRALIASVQEIARQFDASVIAEGVERLEDLTTLRTMAVPIVQGYLMGVPHARPELTVDQSLLALLESDLQTEVKGS
jgi:EAL domain-containing protein (putative c-di-GMP-specific phosphodiesterase class I)